MTDHDSPATGSFDLRRVEGALNDDRPRGSLEAIVRL
jgi:hypothetical protein